jgi:hypothetical protein
MTKKKNDEKQKPEKEFNFQYCKYTFSVTEKAEMSSEMAQKVARLERTEDELKTVKAQFKSETEQLARDISTTAEKLNSGYEMRNIKCEVIRDYREGIVEYVRTDTGEIAKSRKMRDDERQMQIDDKKS